MRTAAQVVGLITLLSLSACRAEMATVGPPEPTTLRPLGTRSVPMAPAPISGSAEPSLRERHDAAVLGRALARALTDASARQELKQALAGSLVREHKLELASFLEGRGGTILQASQRNGGPGTLEVQRAIGGMRALEFYMPVAAHRRAWTGTEDVLVAVALDKSAPPVAFALDGRQVTLDEDHPSATPTLVATTIETDLRSQAADNRQGLGFPCTVGAAESLDAAGEHCEREANSRTGGAAASRVPRPRATLASDPDAIGLYMTFLRLLDAHEYWWQGEPEIEVHVTGRRSAGGAIVDYQCAGEHAADPFGLQPGIRSQSYYFDMNANFWSGSVLLLSPAQVDTLQAQAPAGFNVSVWEDDDANGACVVHPQTGFSWADAVAATQAVSRGIDAIRVRNGPDYGLLSEALHALYNVFTPEGDNYNGLLVSTDSTGYASTYPNNTHVVYIGGSLNGRATLVFKSTSYTAPPAGAVASIEISPATDTVGVGNIRQFSAVAYDASGRPVTGAGISWQSSAPGVASVDAAGTVTGRSGGGATITASSSAITASAPVQVVAPALSVSIGGPTAVGAPGGLCMFPASTRGGTGDLRYEWTLNGAFYGTDSYAEVDVHRGFTLKVIVRDANNAEALASKSVTYGGGAPPCMQ